MSLSPNVRFWYPSRQYLNHKEAFDAEMQRVLTAGDLILREDVEKFEEELAKYLGVSHVISVASGTDALILALKAMNIGQMDEVLVPSYTFRATAEAVHHVGAKPVAYDLDGRYEYMITKKTAGIIPAHLEGLVREDMPQMSDFCRNNGLALIEDSCQALGASQLHGQMAIYSFYPAKILGCFGDGGAIATNNPALAEHLKEMRNHYKGNWSAGYGYNSRLDNLQAAVLRIKLKNLPQALFRRKMIAKRYDKELIGVGLPPERMVYQDYVIVHPEADKMVKHLERYGVQAMKNEYPFPGELTKGPMATAYEANSLRIPCTPEHTDEEITQVIEAVNSYAG